MHRLRLLLTCLLIVFVLVDVVVGYRLLDSGWPKRIGLTTNQKAVEHVQVLTIPFTGMDWLILAVVVGVHAVLFYVVWKAWHSSPVHA